ncbi:hypothetical protein pipiens_009734, partial [Culex pipiens pipiens]
MPPPRTAPECAWTCTTTTHGPSNVPDRLLRVRKRVRETPCHEVPDGNVTSAKTTVFHAGTLEVLQHEEETAGNERSQVEDGDGAWTSSDHPRVGGCTRCRCPRATPRVADQRAHTLTPHKDERNLDFCVIFEGSSESGRDRLVHLLEHQEGVHTLTKIHT